METYERAADFGPDPFITGGFKPDSNYRALFELRPEGMTVDELLFLVTQLATYVKISVDIALWRKLDPSLQKHFVLLETRKNKEGEA